MRPASDQQNICSGLGRGTAADRDCAPGASSPGGARSFQGGNQMVAACVTGSRDGVELTRWARAVGIKEV